MKKILYILLGVLIGAGTFVYAAQPALNSSQVGSTPVSGYYLKTDGTVSTWAAVSGGSGTGSVSTSSQETAGQAAIWGTTNGYPAKLYSVATSTPSVTAPITYSGTLGSFVGGASGAFDCTSATGSVKGCLTSTDWTTFNNKQNTLSNTLANGLTATTTFYNGGVVFSDGSKLTQSSAPANFYWDETNKLLGIGTSTPGAAIHILASSAGNSNIALRLDDNSASASARNWREVVGYTGIGKLEFQDSTVQGGVPLTTRFILEPAGNVGVATTSAGSLFSVGGDAVGINLGLATSTWSTTGGINLASGCYAIGGTCVGGGSASLTGTTGQVPYFSGTNTAVGTSTLFIDTNGRVGIGTTTPSVAKLTIQPDSSSLMALYVASTTGASDFEVDGATGFASVGSTTPWGLLSVNPNALGSGRPEFVIGSSTTTHLIVDGGGNVGIGSTTPAYPFTANVGSSRAEIYSDVSSAPRLSVRAKAGLSNPTPGIDFTRSDYISNIWSIVLAGNGNNELAFLWQGGTAFRITTGGILQGAHGLAVGGISTTPPTDGIYSSGSVGIGTSTPPSVLTVGATSAQLVSSNPLMLMGTSTLISASANGTYIGVNAPTGFTGNLIDMQKAGTSEFKVSGAGTMTAVALSVGTNNFSISGNGSVTAAGGAPIILTGSGGGNANIDEVEVTGSALTASSGDSQVERVYNTINPSSGTGTFEGVLSNFTVNQTSSASGIVRDSYISPTLTKAADYRAFEIAGYTYNVAAGSLASDKKYGSLFNAYTLATTSSGTLPNASLVNLSGAPKAGTNMTLSTSTALMIEAGAVNGGGTVTRAYGLQVQAPTGATTNYSAAFTGGNMGIGTTSPYATVSIQTGASTGDAFAIATSSGNAVFGVDNDGHRFTSGPAGALSTCGTGSPTITGDDQTGTITTGTAATACTLTFAKAFRNTPVCNFNDDSSTIPGDISSISTTAITFALGAGLSGGHLYYSCAYHQ